MASRVFQTTLNVNYHSLSPSYVSIDKAKTKFKIHDGFYSSSSSCFCFTGTSVKNCSFVITKRSWSWCCHATNPNSEPPSNKQNNQSSGVVATLTRFQDTLQIFFAVLFWMSLFFWSCAWDGKDNNGRPNKGSRFRK